MGLGSGLGDENYNKDPIKPNPNRRERPDQKTLKYMQF